MRLEGTLLLPPQDPQALEAQGESPWASHTEQAAVRLVPGSIRVDDGRITDVQLHPDAPIGSPLICPGFVDAHLHLPQFDILGAAGLPLLDWLGRVTYPAEMRWADPALAERQTQRAVDQLLAHGTTSFAAYATSHHESARRALQVITHRRLRAVVGQVLMDQQAPAELCVEPQFALRETETLLYEFGAFTAVTPRFAICCSDDMLRGAGQLAQKHKALVQTHVSENLAECDQVRRLHGAGYVEVYDRAGLLGPRSILAHGIHLDKTEKQRLADTQTVIAHCPTANVFLASGAMRRFAGRFSLGSDIGAGYERSMVRVARAMIETATFAGGPIPSAAQAWAQITAGNADALGFADVGRIAVGNRADLVMIKPDVPWTHAPDPLGMLLFAWDNRWISRVWLGGEPVV